MQVQSKQTHQRIVEDICGYYWKRTPYLSTEMAVLRPNPITSYAILDWNSYQP
jgi:hypothetical protein